MTAKLPIADYDYVYPEELIAAQPAEPRDSSRLLVLDRASGRTCHRVFHELPGLLKPGDCLVLNRTKVLPCRLLGKKATGGKVDLLLVRECGTSEWTALSSGLKSGQALEFSAGVTGRVEGLTAEGEYRIRFSSSDMRAFLAEHGLPPLPPYIAKRRIASRDDAERYQTIYARDEGSIAAPTAGLHFTQDLLNKLTTNGVAIAWVTLHVGRGTFRPIVGEDAASHAMLPERYEIDATAAEQLRSARRAGGRLIAVGTTVTRTLETLCAGAEPWRPSSGESSLYIRPGHEFKGVDALLTNFHLPRSTPLLLASAFAGREKLMAAYREAVQRRYRLFSFGDAMLIL